MQRVWVGLGIVLLVGFVLFSFSRMNEEVVNTVSPSPSASPSASPDPLVILTQQFYDAYSSCMKNPPKEAEGMVSNWCQVNTGLTTEGFEDNLKAGGVAAAGADPITCAQNTATSTTAEKVTKQVANKAEVNVVEMFGTITTNIEVILVKDDSGKWWVNNVICPKP